MDFPFELDILTLVGLSIVAAFLTGQLFRKIKIPQVVGFIIAGLLLGPSFLNLLPDELNAGLTFVSEIALGLIGFDIGGHLHFAELRKLGKSILFIVVLEAFGAFLLVGAGAYLLTQSLPLALVLGALASATAPAATVEVLAEYRAEGPLTTTLRAVLGLDDAVALLLFSIAAAIAERVLVGRSETTLLEMIGLPVYELGGALIVGTVFGLLLRVALLRYHASHTEHDSVVLPIGAVFLCAGLSKVLGFSEILTTMVMGSVLVNQKACDGMYIRTTIERVGPVIYVLFFVLAGARLHVAEFLKIGMLGIAYILLRSSGKFAGAWLGGRLGKAQPAVRKNLGLALLTQGGVAIGLAMDSATRFSHLGPEGVVLGATILTLITATTMVVEIVGPIGVKFAITRAGEVGKASDVQCAD